VIDAYRRELLADDELGTGTSLFVNAYRLSLLVPGSLALILSDILPWSTVYWVTALFMLVGILTTFIIKEVSHNSTVLFVVVSGEYLGVGLGAIALTAYMARETSKSFTATQFALFSSLIAVPRIFTNASTGFIIEAVGYTQFFIICTLVAIPGMLLLLKVAPWNEKT